MHWTLAFHWSVQSLCGLFIPFHNVPSSIDGPAKKPASREEPCWLNSLIHSQGHYKEKDSFIETNTGHPRALKLSISFP